MSQLPATLRAFFLPVLYIVSPTLYITKYHYEIRNVSGESMSPFLSPDYHIYGRKDTVLIRKDIQLADRLVEEGGDGSKSELERGMIVVFRTPWKPESTAVKRVVALEGDKVQLVKRRTYKIAAEGVAAKEFGKEGDIITVPFGHVWVEGEGGVRTLDSNDYGPISKSLIHGVVTKVLLPRKRYGDLKWREAWQEKCQKRVTKASKQSIIPEEWSMG